MLKFFFQAEDGIRDLTVTGVQTCALPILIVRRQPAAAPVPFAAREQALAAHPGRPLDNTTMRALRTSTPNANARPFVRPAIPEQRGQTPAPALRPVREGLPPSRTRAPTAVAHPERRRPAAPVATPEIGRAHV